MTEQLELSLRSTGFSFTIEEQDGQVTGHLHSLTQPEWQGREFVASSRAEVLGDCKKWLESPVHIDQISTECQWTVDVATLDQGADDDADFDLVDESSRESFPASDPPAWVTGGMRSSRSKTAGTVDP